MPYVLRTFFNCWLLMLGCELGMFAGVCLRNSVKVCNSRSSEPGSPRRD